MSIKGIGPLSFQQIIGGLSRLKEELILLSKTNIEIPAASSSDGDKTSQVSQKWENRRCDKGLDKRGFDGVAENQRSGGNDRRRRQPHHHSVRSSIIFANRATIGI